MLCLKLQAMQSKMHVFRFLHINVFSMQQQNVQLPILEKHKQSLSSVQACDRSQLTLTLFVHTFQPKGLIGRHQLQISHKFMTFRKLKLFFMDNSAQSQSWQSIQCKIKEEKWLVFVMATNKIACVFSNEAWVQTMCASNGCAQQSIQHACI